MKFQSVSLCFQSFVKAMPPSSFQNLPAARRVLLVDTDAGCDDILALSSLLDTKAVVSIPFISTVGGMQSSPHRAAAFCQAAYPSSNVVAGRVPAMQIHEKESDVPEWLREVRSQLDGLMTSMGIPEDKSKNGDTDPTNRVDDEEVLKKLLCDPKLEESSVDLLCIGPLTNIAAWVQNEELLPLLVSKINQIWIMGGNLPGKSNSNDAEFNFAQDPKAVSIIMGCDSHSSLREKIYIVPAQTCEKTSMLPDVWNSIVQEGTRGEGMIGKVLKTDSIWYNLQYDPLCAFAYAHPSSITTETMDIVVDDKGLLVAAESHLESESLSTSRHALKLVTDIQIDGFTSWFKSVIDAENKRISD